MTDVIHTIVYVCGAIMVIALTLLALLLIWWPIAAIGGKVFHWIPRTGKHVWRDTAWPDKRLHFYGFGLRIGNGWLGYLRHEWETMPTKEAESDQSKEGAK